MPTDRSHGASPDSNSGRLSVRLSPRLLSRVGAAVEDGPYHSRSHLVRTALHLLLASPDDGRPDRRGGDASFAPVDAARSDDAVDPTWPDGVRVGAIREVLAGTERASDPPHVAVELLDERNGVAGTHAFVYDVDSSNRTATLRTYDPPARLTRDRSTAVGALREAADAALEARNWRVRRPPGADATDGEPADSGEYARPAQ